MKKVFLMVLIFFTSCSHGTEIPIDLSVDLLLWQLYVSGDENWAQDISPEGARRSATALNVPFKWQPGVRVGIGKKDFPCIDCALDFKYTWYQSTAFRSAVASSGGLYSSFSSNFYANNTNGASFGPNYQNASIKWKVLFNTFDLELAQTFKFNPGLQLKPFIGLKIASINQHMYTSWQNPNPKTFFGITIPQNFTFATENIKNNFYGVGPSFGLYSAYVKSFVEAFADFSTALMWGHWSFYDVYKNNNNTNISTNSSNINGAVPMLAGRIGLAWKHGFSDILLKIHLSYEAQIWFNQLQYYNFNMGRLNNLLSVQGMVFGAVVALR